MNIKKKKAIVLGAGPAGLVTAWKLLENGWSVRLFEKLGKPGGMCRSWKWKNFIVDTGPHIFHTPDDKLKNFWKKEFGDLLLEGKFWCQNIQGKKFEESWDYPLSFESIKKYPKEKKLRIFKELKKIKNLNNKNAKNFSDYMKNQVGDTLYKMFFHKYPKKIWGIEPDKITAEWAPKRIEIRKKILPFYTGQYAAVGKYGTGKIYERILQKIKKLGGKVHLNNSINKFVFKKNLISQLKTEKGKIINIDKDEYLISSLPITLTSKLLGYDSKLKFRGIKSIYLIYDKKNILPGRNQWQYYDDHQIIFNRVTENKKLSKFVSPSHQTMLTAEITFSKGDKVDLMPDKKLINLVKFQIQKVGLVNEKYFIEGSTNTERFVYPVQSKGYNEDLAYSKLSINKYEKLYSIGTGGEFNYADSQILFHKAFDLVDILTDKESSKSQTKKISVEHSLNKEVALNNTIVGDNHKPYIIAEIGLNHNNDIQIAKKLIDEAKNCNCDAVKFQTYLDDARVSKEVKSAKYYEKVIGLEENLSETFSKLKLTPSQHKEIFKYAKSKKIDIFSTPFDLQSVDFLNFLGVKFFKIASVDLVNLPLIKKVSETQKPIILSCGMSTLGQVEDAVNVVKSTGNKNLILLHCNSSYPATIDEMNLNVIKTLKNNFKVPVGLSDHTFGLLASQTAISIGANIIERHFTLNRSMEGPDHILSSEPSEMELLVKSSYQIPKMLGNGIKIIQPNEYVTLNNQRKCIYAKKDIKKGSIITDKMIQIKGPGGGILPKYLEIILGRKATSEIKKDHPIMWKNI